jgi:hypothetical protein
MNSILNETFQDSYKFERIAPSSTSPEALQDNDLLPWCSHSVTKRLRKAPVA